jgi:DNA invertase Pin-like site-specific DNA recombinase
MSQVYSYIRFSSIKQRAGTSIERQLDYAKRWAVEHGMALDESLTMRDEGLSAFHGRHVKQGALGVFLDAVQAGRIPPGSVLIVEGLDRLSRAEPILAQAQLAQIINADITVVTAADGKQYHRESLKANPMDLVYSLLVMIRAHEESETKSQRAKAALRKHCETWLATGQRRGGRHGKLPQWLAFVDGEWVLREDRAAAIRLALDMFRRGHGHVRIADTLAERRMQMTDGNPNSNQIYRLIRNPALAGTRVVVIDGERFALPGYYPAIVTTDEFDRLQAMMAQRAPTGGASIRRIPGIITGIGVAFCGYCVGPMVAMNLSSRARGDGTLSDGNRRINCACKATKRPCPHPASCQAGLIERAIMTYCADQMNLSALLEGGDRLAPMRARLAVARGVVAELEQKLERVTEALLAADDGATPLVFVRKARELEGELGRARSEAKAAERDLSAASQAGTPAKAEAWRALVNGVASLDEEARMMARKLVRDTFERIAIYGKGFLPDEDGQTIGLILVGKGGGSRILTIDRKTGDRRAADDFGG